MRAREHTPRRVVITGLGLVSPLGNSVTELWESLEQGRSGVAASPTLSASSLPMDFGGEARQFTGRIEDFGPLPREQQKSLRKALKLMCRESQMAMAAASHAMADAGLVAGGFDPQRAGIVFGSDYMLSEPEDVKDGIRQCTDTAGTFQVGRWGTEGMWKMTPLWLLKYLPNMPACHVAIFHDLRGPNNSITAREASSNLAVGEAFRIIARGGADLMLAGATGTRLHPMKAIHAAQQEEVATRGLEPAKASRPFDFGRSGMVLGEGAGTVVLEEFSLAIARGAPIHGEIVAAASSTVADRDFRAKRDVALANVISWTLREGHLAPRDVGHIHAHGLSTRTSDADEARAIGRVFADPALQVPVVAAKSYFGNLGAGSGAVELIASILAMRHGRLFPILNYESPDPQCPIAAVRSADQEPGRNFLNLNVTAQGQASALLVRTCA